MGIIVVEPQMKPTIRHINGFLSSMQDIVGGTIQAMYPYDDAVALLANDEGKVLGLPMNRALRDMDGKIDDVICGTFFICGVSGEVFISLTDEQIERYTRLFYVSEVFLHIGRQIMVLKVANEEGGKECEM